MVGGAAAAPDPIARAVVLIVGSRGNFCSGAALARDLVLTAAHCVLPGRRLQDRRVRRGASAAAARRRARHRASEIQSRRPCWRTARPRTWRCSSSPLRSARVAPAALYGPGFTVAPGDGFTVAGTGVAVRGDGKSGGTVRAARSDRDRAARNLADPPVRSRDPRREAGAWRLHRRFRRRRCSASTDGRPPIVGVVSWSTGPAKFRRLRRPDRRDAADPVSRLDHADRKNTREPTLILPSRR